MTTHANSLTGQLAKVAQLFIFGKDGKKVKVGSAFRGLCFSPSGARNSISLYVVALRGVLASVENVFAYS